MTATFLTAGEALTDIVVRSDGDRQEHPGGSPLNVAVALARLGHASHLLTRIGRDARGDAIRGHVEGSSARLTPGSITDAPTSTALARIGADGAAQYEFELTWDPDPSGLPAQVDAVHTSSIAAVLEPGASTVARVLDQYADAAMISYDPNARPALMGEAARARSIIEGIVRRADVVKTSDEDVEWLYGTSDVEDVVSSWLAPAGADRGPALAVVTRGGEGAIGFTRAAGRIQVAPVRVTVADTVGAGDTFSAGILHALAGAGLIGADRREALRAADERTLRSILAQAAKLAAITVSRPGADPPWAHELS